MSAPPDANGDPLYLYVEVVLKSNLDLLPPDADRAALRRGSVWWIDGRRVRVEWPNGDQQDFEASELILYEPPGNARPAKG